MVQCVLEYWISHNKNHLRQHMSTEHWEHKPKNNQYSSQKSYRLYSALWYCDGFSHDYLSYLFGIVVAFCSFQHYSFHSFVLLFIEVVVVVVSSFFFFFSFGFRIFHICCCCCCRVKVLAVPKTASMYTILSFWSIHRHVHDEHTFHSRVNQSIYYCCPVAISFSFISFHFR